AVLLDVEDDGVDAVVDVVRLAGDLLAARQDGLGLAVAQRDGGGAVLEALDGALDEVAFFGGVLVEDGLALRLAGLLDHELLARLGGDAPQQLGIDRLVALLDLDGAAVAVDGDADVLDLAALAAEVLLGGEVDGRLDGAEDGLAVDVAVAVHLID